MRYVEAVNRCIQAQIGGRHDVLLFGQNISRGSQLGGLGRGLSVGLANGVINTPNSENTLVGVGFGLMLNGVSSIFLMKQQDFLLLGIDQLVNTYNVVRMAEPKAAFTIVHIVVDQGFQGPQSSLNNLSDFCSIARIPGYVVSNRNDIESILGRHLLAPGFRMIAVSQRLFRTDVLSWPELILANPDHGVFQYEAGAAATVVCFNFSLSHGVAIRHQLLQRGLAASLFSVNAGLPTDWQWIIDEAKTTGKLLVLDDSKSANLASDRLLVEAHRAGIGQVLDVRRHFGGNDWLYPNADELSVDSESVIQAFAN